MYGWWGREPEGLPPLRRFEVTDDSNSKNKVPELDGLPKANCARRFLGVAALIPCPP